MTDGPTDALLEYSVRFRALHHYRHPEWDEARNREVFGALVEPHPHDWVVTVTACGPMAELTGFSTDLPAVEQAVEAVVAPLRDGDLNIGIPEVVEGRMLPSCEALARWFFRAIAPGVPAPARLVQVRVAESDQVAAIWPVIR